MGDDDTWLIVKLTSRAGKSKGIHQFCWNTTNPLGIHKVVDFSKDVSEWELLDPDKSDEGAIPTEIYATSMLNEKTSFSSHISTETTFREKKRDN